MKEIVHSKPWLCDSDLESMAPVFRSGMVAQGERTRAFERAMARWVCVETSGVAVGSGTAAVLLALLALGAGPGDEVVLPTYVCHTVLEAVITTGATPVCCDVGQDWVVTAETILPCVNKRTRAVIVPHIYGIFADVSAIRDLGIPVVEDCAQAVAGSGSRAMESDIAVFSFHPTKCLTTGEGGMTVSPNPDLVSVMREIRDGGTDGIKGRLLSPLSDLASALGLSQLSRYAESLKRRKELVHAYFRSLSAVIPESLPQVSDDRTMWYRLPLRLSGGIDVWRRHFAERGIHVRMGVDRLLHRSLDLHDDSYPAAVRHFQETVSLPLYPALTDEEHARVLDAAVEIFSKVEKKRQ